MIRDHWVHDVTTDIPVDDAIGHQQIKTITSEPSFRYETFFDQDNDRSQINIWTIYEVSSNLGVTNYEGCGPQILQTI